MKQDYVKAREVGLFSGFESSMIDPKRGHYGPRYLDQFVMILQKHCSKQLFLRSREPHQWLHFFYELGFLFSNNFLFHIFIKCILQQMGQVGQAI